MISAIWVTTETPSEDITDRTSVEQIPPIQSVVGVEKLGLGLKETSMKETNSRRFVLCTF